MRPPGSRVEEPEWEGGSSTFPGAWRDPEIGVAEDQWASPDWLAGAEIHPTLQRFTDLQATGFGLAT